MVLFKISRFDWLTTSVISTQNGVLVFVCVVCVIGGCNSSSPFRPAGISDEFVYHHYAVRDDIILKYIFANIYIYMCVCVCVCVLGLGFGVE